MTMADTATNKMDPFTAEIQSFFVAQLGNLPAGKGISLNFEPMAQPISGSDFLGPTGDYSQTLADEYFSINIADRPAHVVDGVHYSHQLVSISELLEANVLLQATFYARADLAEHVNEKNQKTLESLLATASDRMEQTRVALSAQPRTYHPSNAIPKRWCDPSAVSGWQRFSKTLISTSQVDESEIDDHDKDDVIFRPSFRLPWRSFDPDELRKLVEQLKKSKPSSPFPPKGINELDAVPKWVKATPKPFTADEIGNFGTQFLNNKQLGKLGSSGLPPSAGKLGGIKVSSTGGLHSGGGLSGLQHGGASGITGLGGHGGLGGLGGGSQMMMSESEPTATLLQPSAVNVEDFTATETESVGLSEVFKAAALKNAVVTTESDDKDRIAVSFEYQIISIDRPWLYLPLLQNSNWYIQGARRGELSLGKEGEPHGLLGIIPDRMIVIKNLQIQATFNDSDRAALGASFAIGPFALDPTVDLQEQTLTVPGMKILGYVDVELPIVPPRSDPQFLT